MSLRELENIKSKQPHLRQQIDGLETFLAKELAAGRTRVVPTLVARHLRLSEAEMLAILMMFEDAKLLRSTYEVVCKKSEAVLAVAHNKAELKDLFPIYCSLDDEKHGPEDLRIELVFEITPNAYPLNVAA
jgi:hypothetical protein